MPRVVEIEPSHTPSELRHLAAATRDANQSRRLLSIAAVVDGMGRADAAKIGGMDRQTLRDRVHRFNAHGPAGLKDNRRRGNPRRPDGTPQEISSGRRTLCRSCCRRGRRSSIPSSRSGNTCAPTISPTASSTDTTTSSAPPVTHGESSSPSHRRSPQSECAIGLKAVKCDGRWYYGAPRLLDASKRAG